MIAPPIMRRTLRVLGPPQPVHRLGSSARVLLSSVFGPYARDDAYGSRELNPMELYHNQVTRVQGAFSLRMFHRSWGIMMIRDNINAPCALLDFPDLDRFVREIATHRYDIVGISSIIPNILKVKRMCELVRQHLPGAEIVVGGHVANAPDIEELIDADHIVKGEGVQWMRRYLGEDDSRPVVHPRVVSGVGARTFGIGLSTKPGHVAATLIPSVGCPMGCNFCSTSAMFGGKGKCFHFYETGDELFEVMCGLERDMGVRTFFVMDENFLLHRKRALRLLELMQTNNKAWAMYVFASANVLRAYTMEQLVGLGISWLWMGIEGEDTGYAKLKGVNTRDLVTMLQSHGIRVLGSTIIGLENHTPENIDAVIDHAVAHDTEFHQFMLYTPLAGTPLYAEHVAAGTLLDPAEVSDADAHGQDRFRHKHPNIKDGQETEFLLRAFRRDFSVNGPSVIRVARTALAGWKRYKNHPDLRIRDRFAFEIKDLPIIHAAALWAARARVRGTPLATKISQILRDIHREFGLRSRIATPLVGRYIRFKLKREERRLARGDTYEPPTFYETTFVRAATC